MKIRTDIIYTGIFQFPEGNAAGARVLGIGKALRDAGLRVMFAGWEDQGRSEDRGADGIFRYQGFPYVSQASHEDLGTTHRRRTWSRLLGTPTISRLDNLDLDTVRAVVAYNAPSPMLWRLAAFCRRRGLACIADVTEWYDPQQLPGGFGGPLWLDSETRMRMLHPRLSGVLAISSFLRNYYEERGCHVLRVPPLVDVEDAKWNQPVVPADSDDVLNLVYVGTPGHKDLFGGIVRALARFRSGKRPVLHVIGPSFDELSGVLGSDAPLLDAVSGKVICYGRLPHVEALRQLQQADFSLLVRPLKRYAEAGFPTKLVESLAAGVPVITNATSDIAEYVRNGQEGILLHDTSPGAVEAGVRRALTMSTEERQAMRTRARARAAMCFDYRQHTSTIAGFINQAITAPRCGLRWIGGGPPHPAAHLKING